VVFFPALVTIAFRPAGRLAAGVRPVPRVRRRKWMIARKVMVPSALPAVFASARVGVPGR